MQEENYGRMNLASQTDENSVDAWDEAFEEELEEEPKEKKHLLKKSGQMVTVLQIGLCGLILLAAFLLRLLGGAPYQTVRLWYEEEMNKSVIAGTIVEEGEKTLQNFSAQVGETIENLGKKGIGIVLMKFTFRGCRIFVSFWFAAILAVSAVLDPSGGVLCGLLAAVAHELGHLLEMARQNCLPKKIAFKNVRVDMVDSQPEREKLSKGFANHISGSGFKFFVSRLCFPVYLLLPYQWLGMFFSANLLVGFFNIQPIAILGWRRMPCMQFYP